MSKQRATSFPTNPPFGTTHFELGRTWEYVEPGMWKSKDGQLDWDGIEGKPDNYPPSPHLHEIEDVNGLRVELDTETQARIDGDAALQDQIDVLEAYDDTQIKADLAAEEQARIDGDAALQDQIDNIDVAMDEPTSDGKPYSRTVAGGQTDGTWVEAPTTDDITYLDNRIDAIEGNITDGGGFIEAPNDGSVYARDGLAPAWVKTYDANYIDAIDAAYKNADLALQDQINALEAYDDTQINADLAAETQARIDGDAALQGQIDVLEAYDDTQINADLATETQARIDGDAALQDQIDVLEAYDDTQIKADLAAEEQARIDGDAALQGQIDGLEAYDDTQIKADLAAEEQARIDGDAALQGQIDDIDVGASLTDAPNDGKQYARQFVTDAMTWAEVVSTGGGSGNPVVISDTAPLDPSEGDLWFDTTDTNEGLFAYDGAFWFEVTSPGADGPPGPQGPPGEGGAGSSVHIGENPPADPEEGQQWMEVPATGDAIMWVYDGDKWLQQPSSGGSGVSGGESLWTDDGDGNISYSSGIVHAPRFTSGEINTRSDGYIYFNSTVQFNDVDNNGDPIGGPPKLQIRGDGVRSWNPIQATDFLDADGNSIVGTGGGGESLWAQDENSPDIYFTKGKVGIGTSSPNLNLTVQDAWGAGIGIKALNGAAEAMMNFSNSECSWNIGTSSGGSLAVTDASNANQPLVINADGDATFSGRVHVGDRSAQEPLDVAGEFTSTTWNDGVERYRMARFENSAALAASGIRTGMNFWHDNNRGVVLQGATNGGNLSLGVRSGATDNIAMTIDATGNVGVGADASQRAGLVVETMGDPNTAAKLALKSNADTYLRFARYGTATDAGMAIGNNYSRDNGVFSTDDTAFGISRISFGTAGDLIFGTDPAGTDGDVPTTRLTIDATGNAKFTGSVSANKQIYTDFYLQTNSWRSKDQKTGLFLSDTSINPINYADDPSGISNGEIDLGANTSRFKDGWFSGNIYKNGSTSPLINGTDLIKTLSTLRNATKDETTLEGMRDALGDAISGLIEDFEHQIATMPAEEES